MKKIKSCILNWLLWLAGLAVLLITLLLVTYEFAIWQAHDYSFDAWAIDACLDQGGAWQKDTNACSHNFGVK